MSRGPVVPRPGRIGRTTRRRRVSHGSVTTHHRRITATTRSASRRTITTRHWHISTQTFGVSIPKTLVGRGTLGEGLVYLGGEYLPGRVPVMGQ